MRIAIDYRVLSTEAADRGMGRYTQQQLREVLKLDKDNEYLVICYRDAKRHLIFPEISSARNVKVKYLKLPVLQHSGDQLPEEQLLLFSAQFQDYLYKEKVDLFHLTCPFLPPMTSHFDVCRFVATIYDFIPLIYPREYLTVAYDDYVRTLHLLQKAERLISISESAKLDAYAYLGYPKAQVDVAYPIIEPFFRVLPESDTATVLDDLRKRVPIPERFILSVTGIHHSKNAKTLLDAYGRLPEALRRELPLVIVLPAQHAYHTFLHNFGNPEHVILTNSVSDNELTALYNAAMMLVHPSRYEGFGYPVAEAMKCGTPVITTTASSLPEVGGDAAMLLDPDDAAGFAQAIEALYNDPVRRDLMRERGLLHAQRFNPEQLGRITLASYEKACRVAQDDRQDGRRHIAIWSSFPPLKCGVGDYTSELVEQLDQVADVEVFVDKDYLPSAYFLNQYTIQHHTAFDRRDEQQPFDMVIYQMGGTYMQEFMYDAIQKRSGIVVLHDLLMGLGFFYIYHSLDQIGKFKRNILLPEGGGVAQAYERIMQNSADLPREALDELFSKHYLLRWITNNSLGQIVHMRDAKEDLEAQYDNANVHVVHMGVADPWAGRQIRNFKWLRHRHGFKPSTFLIGIFGSVVPVKRIEACLRALDKLRETHPDCLMLIVGNPLDPVYMDELTRLIEELGVGKHVRFYGHIPRENFDDLFLTCDVVLNLRYPSRKGMSAILMRTLAAGKPIIISDIPEWSDLPDAFCWRVKPDKNEVGTIARYLVTLAEDPALRAEISDKARAYFEQYGTLWHMAAQYLDVVEDILAQKQRA